MRKLMALVPVVALVLVACGGSGDDPAEADVEFAQMMIPHHEQAVEMSDLVDGSDASPEVVDLADRIRAAQDPEIRTMRGWLESWDVDEDTGHGGHMDGMMSGHQMAGLESASGPDFDRLWLTMMIQHHEGAVTMAEDVLDEGEDPDVADLAREIIDAQQAEIAEMEALLDD